MLIKKHFGGAMGLKNFDHRRVDNAEIAQLVILYNIYAQKRSSKLIFQGGTAIRWCYSGTRFSEDLDFVTSLSIADTIRFLDWLQPSIKNDFILHFGPGEFFLKWKDRSRKSACRCFIEYRPAGSREKIAVKIEFERLKPNIAPEMNKFIFAAMPAISYMIRKGNLKVPPFGCVIQVEKPEEILSDKIRALLERAYVKGRDFYDIAFLTRTLELKPENRLIQRKLSMYEAPFRLSRTIGYYLDIGRLDQKGRDDLTRTLEQDLSRFIPSNDLIALKQQHFSQIVIAVADVFKDIQHNGGLDLSGYEEGAGIHEEPNGR
jgi:predicted nucleotidyltransferase component of viral defense system